MKDWFESLETRERLFVSVGAAVLMLALIYALAWAPLDRNHQLLRTDVENWERSLADLRQLRSVASNDGQPTSALGPAIQQAPIMIVDQSLRSRGLEGYIRRSQPTTSNGIRVEFESVAFDELVLWLGDLSDQYGMHVQAGSFSPGSRPLPGRINATLTLERAL